MANNSYNKILKKRQQVIRLAESLLEENTFIKLITGTLEENEFFVRLQFDHPGIAQKIKVQITRDICKSKEAKLFATKISEFMVMNNNDDCSSEMITILKDTGLDKILWDRLINFNFRTNKEDSAILKEYMDNSEEIEEYKITDSHDYRGDRKSLETNLAEINYKPNSSLNGRDLTEMDVTLILLTIHDNMSKLNELEEVTEDLSKLLIFKSPIMEEIYDLCNVFLALGSKHFISSTKKKLIATLKRLKDKYKEVDIYREYRRFTSNVYLSNNNTNSLIITAIYVITFSFGQGFISSVTDKKVNRIKYFGNSSISPIEIMGWLLIEIKKRNKDSDILSGIELNSLSDKLKQKYGVEIFKEVYSILEAQKFNAFLSTFVINYVTHIFEGSDNSMSMAISLLGIGEQDYNDSQIFTLFTGVANVFRDFRDILKLRNVYVKDDGITIRLRQCQDNITHIHLKEVHNFEDNTHYILLSYLCSDGLFKKIPLFIEDIRKSNQFLIYEIDVSAIFITLAWMSAMTRFVKQLDELSDSSFIKSIDKEFYSGTKGLGEVTDTVAKLTQIFLEITRDDNIFYEKPYSWNYDYKSSNNKSVGGRSGVAIQVEQAVGRYTRRLPVGQQASYEAQELAKMYKMNLEEGYTFVDEFVRKTNIHVK